MWILYIEFIYRITAVSYSTSQEEYREIFVFNFFPKSRGMRIFITFLGFRPTVHRRVVRQNQISRDLTNIDK